MQNRHAIFQFHERCQSSNLSIPTYYKRVTMSVCVRHNDFSSKPILKPARTNIALIASIRVMSYNHVDCLIKEFKGRIDRLLKFV